MRRPVRVGGRTDVAQNATFRGPRIGIWVKPLAAELVTLQLALDARAQTLQLGACSSWKGRGWAWEKEDYFIGWIIVL
jgi:hypothetical protein